MKSEDTIYIAGFVDGEGSIGIRKDHKSYAPILSLGHTDETICQWLKKTIGTGWVAPRGSQKPEWKDQWQFGISGKKNLVPVLKELLPYLRVKKRQAELVIKFCENRDRKLKGRPHNVPYDIEDLAIIQELHRINKKGK